MDSLSLMKLSGEQLKQRCVALGTHTSGNKAKLISRVLEPAKNQKRRKESGGGGSSGGGDGKPPFLTLY